jgi:hypothetical protein
MKKFLFRSLSVFMAIILLVTQSQILSAKPLGLSLPGIDETVLYLDEAALDNAMGELNNLDDFINQNQGITYADLKAMDSKLIVNLSDELAPMGATGENDDTLGIPPFWWGCVLGWVGILLVYLLTDNDKEKAKQALYGCLVQTGVVGILYVLYYFVIYQESGSI